MANDLRRQLKGVASSLAELKSRVVDLNDKLEDAIERRHDVALAPPTKVETVEKLAALVDHRAERYAYTFRSQVYSTFRAPIDASKSKPVPGVGELFMRRTFDGDVVDSDALHFFLGDLLKQKIRAEVEAMPWPGPEGLPADERQKALSELDTEIEALESEKENLFTQLRESGLSVTERDVLTPASDDGTTVIKPKAPPRVVTSGEPKVGGVPAEIKAVEADLRGDDD